MGHEERLKFFASPLHTGEEDHGHTHNTPPKPHDHESSIGSQHSAKQPTNTENVPFDRDEEMHSSPHFHRHAEATTAELFYDLFFVANLTTFTSLLDINDSKSLTSYIGFFTLLWLTWYQVSLYDVRFSSDSIFERCAKSIHFGTMVGFAVMAPQWKPGYGETEFSTQMGFSLILMVSRLTLAAQYGVTLWFTKNYIKTRVPLLLVLVSSLVAAVVYGGMLDVPKTSNIYIAWYVVGVAETIMTVSVSCIWRTISFKGTHMVQRMSLLTLIILGEGIIVICKSISKIVKNDYIWTAAVIGQVISAILVIYFLYMLYFDRLSEDHFGSNRQQVWSFLHFPLHAVFVLVLQGVANFVTWRQAIQGLNDVVAQLVIDTSETYADGQELIDQLNSTAQGLVFAYVPKGIDASKEFKTANEAMKTMGKYYVDQAAGNETASGMFWEAFGDLLGSSATTVLNSLSIKAPKKSAAKDASVKPDPMQSVNDLFGVFELIFVYTFIAGGLALILLSVISTLSLTAEKRKRSQYIRIGLAFAAGVALCLITLLRYNADARGNYMASAWMVPTLCIVYFVCVVANHIRVQSKTKAH